MGGLGATYDVHLNLIGKRPVDFLLLLIGRFAIGATALVNKWLSYRRETALQGGLVMAKSGRLKLGENIYRLYRSIFNHCDVFGEQRNQNWRKKRKIKAVTPFKVIQGHRGRHQSNVHLRLPITD